MIRKRTIIQILTISVITAALMTGCGLQLGDSQALTDGMAQIESRSFDEAVTTLQTAIDSGDDSRDMYRTLGIAEMGTGDYESAAKALETALGSSGIIPDDMDYDINFYLASCYYKLGNYDDAMEIYNAITGMDDSNTDAYEMRGATEITQGDSDAADADFRKAIALSPKDYDRIISMYATMKQYGQEDAGKAYLSEAISSDPNMSDYDKGRLSYYLEDYATAKACFEASQDKNDYRTTLMLGKTYIAQGDLNYAADVYEAYIAADQTHAEIYNELGLCYLQLEEYEKALNDFQIGQKIDNNGVMQDLLYNEIVAYEKLGQFPKAEEMMQSYLKSYPDDQDAQREQLFLQTR